MKMTNYHINIRGKVQGVGFRFHAKRVALMLGLSGYVKNMPDETVFIEIEGAEDRLKEFVRWCHLGPERAHVKKVDIEEGNFQNFNTFETRF